MINTGSILIAEDESIIALDVKGILERSGYTRVSFVRDSKALLNKVKEEIPSLIVMDIHLKDKDDGIETAKQVWKQHNVPVVFISGADTRFLKVKLNSEKCSFIKKPFKEAELLKAVKSFLTAK